MYLPYLLAQIVALCFLLAALGLSAVAIGTNYWSETTFLLTTADDSAIPLDRLRKQSSSYHEVEKVDGLWRECSAIFAISNELIAGTLDSYASARSLVFEYCYNRYQSVIDQSRQVLNDLQFDSAAVEARDHGIRWWQIACMACMCIAAFFGAAAAFITPVNYPRCRGLAALLVLIAAVFAGIAVVIYSCMYDQTDISYHNHMQSRILSTRFGWSLWFAVGSCASFLVASFAFVIAAKIRHLRDYTQVSHSLSY